MVIFHSYVELPGGISVVLGIHVINILWTHMEINGWVNSKVSVTWVFIVYIYYGHKKEMNGF